MRLLLKYFVLVMTGCEDVLGLLTITYVMCDKIILKYFAPMFKIVHYKVILIFQAVDEINEVCHSYRGGEWYLEKRGSRKILAGSRNLGSIFDKSRNLVFAWFVFTFFESRNFLPESRARISN